jgi:hypothetical protein
MMVHADKTGNHGVTGQIENFGGGWRRFGGGIADRLDERTKV